MIEIIKSIVSYLYVVARLYRYFLFIDKNICFVVCLQLISILDNAKRE